MEYKKFSQEQLERAKNADIISFLTAYMGFDFKQSGHYYQCKQHKSRVRKNRTHGSVRGSRQAFHLNTMKGESRLSTRHNTMKTWYLATYKNIVYQTVEPFHRERTRASFFSLLE